MADAPGAGSLVRRTAIGATWMVAWRMVTRLLGLLSTLILARLLMPADFGLVAMATTFSAAVEQMSQLGLQDALVRRRGEACELFDTAFTLQLGRAVLTAAVLAAGAPAAVWWFSEPRLRPVLLVLAAGVVIAGLENIAIAEFRRDMRFGMQFKLLSVPRLLQVALTIPLALWLQTYWALLAGIILSRLGRTAMTYWVHPHRPRLRLAGWRELAGFSLWTWATTLVNTVCDRCDSFVLGPRIGAGPLGLYLLALELATLPATELIAPASDALFAGFAAAQQRGTSSVRLASHVALALLMGILPLIITLSCASGYVIAALLGPQWAAARPLLAILAWQSTFSPFSYVVSVTLVANGLVRRNFCANLVASAVKLAALVTAVSLTSRLDLVAAVTACCMAAEATMFLVMLHGVGGVRLRDIAGGFLRAVGAAAITVVALNAAGLAWEPVALGGLMALVNGALIGAFASVLYASALAALWVLSGRPGGPERQLVSWLRSRIGLIRQPIRGLIWRRRHG